MTVATKKSKGLTLIELLIYIAVTSILLMFTISGFQSFISHKESSTYLVKLKSIIYEAKSLAIKHNTTVTLCPSISLEKCDTKNWSNEILLFIDENGDHQISNSDQLIEILPAVKKGNALFYNAFGPATYIQFQPNGFLSSVNGTFRYCSMIDDKPDIQGIIISRTGRIRDAVNNNGNSTLNTGKIQSCQRISD